jgi:hypothetical protein
MSTDNKKKIEELNEILYKYNRGEGLGNAKWSPDAKKEDIITLFAVSSKLQKKLEKFVVSLCVSVRAEALKEVREEMNKAINGDEDRIMVAVKLFRVLDEVLAKLSKEDLAPSK